jgi:DNA-binding LacI/PurR family transcriptional regulator
MRARIQDVARRAGVSTATVSLVLRNRPGPSQATQAAVRAAADALGYRADRSASTLARHRSHLLGVALDVTSPFHADLVVHLDECAAARDLELVLATTSPRRSERDAIATLQDFRCEALVLLGSAEPDGYLQDVDAQLPVVVIGRTGTPDAVLTDNAAALTQAVDHLVERGHRRIAYVDGPRGPIATDRRRGYRAAMRRHGLADDLAVIRGGDTEAAGLRAGEHLLALPTPPTAAVAFNDRCALGVRESVLHTGRRVPEDLALVGIDDSPLAQLETVGLTSVSQDPTAQAQAAVEAVARRLDGGLPAGVVLLEPHLVVRRTS